MPAREPPPSEERDRSVLKALEEGRRFESYTEQRTREMHTCFLCERVLYRRPPSKKVGAKWICIDCIRELKEVMESLEHWEQMALVDRAGGPST